MPEPLSVQDQQHPVPPALDSPVLSLLLCQVSQTKVWLCRVPQTLPKITPGNARMDEGVFPESFAF